LAKKFKHLKIQKDWVGIYQKDVRYLIKSQAGLLNANEAIRMFQWLAVSKGARIKSNEKFIEFKEGEEITVITDKCQYRARRLLFATGSWSIKILEKNNLNLVPLEIWKTTFGKR
jgi:glycine/D-amino acid oxidase-like deaminating enzyme